MEWIITSELAAYLFCAFMGFVVIILRWRCGSWSNPSVVFALFWCMMTTLPIVFVPEIEPSAGAIGYITAAVTAFAVPVFFISWREPLDATKARQNSVGSIFFSGNEAIVLLSVMQAATLCCMIANVAYQGFPIAEFFLDPFSLGCKYLEYRYGGSVKPYALAQAGTVLNYVAAPLAGLVVAHRKSYTVSTCAVLLCLIPSFYNVAVYADKGTIFLTLAFFYGAVIVGRIRNGYTNLLTVRSMISGLFLLLLVATVMGLAMINRTTERCEQDQTLRLFGLLLSTFKHKSQNLDIPKIPNVDNPKTLNVDKPHTLSVGKPRTLNDDQAEIPKLGTAESETGDGGLKYYIRSYAFGHLFAFSAWYDNWTNTDWDLRYASASHSDWYEHRKPYKGGLSYNDPSRLTYGFWTFMAIGKYVNAQYFTSLPSGYFDEYFTKINVLQSNIHTFFRGLIYDFTIPGSLFILSLIGFIFNILYRNLLLYPFYAFLQVMYVFFVGFLYTSYIISLMIWSSPIFASFCMVLLLRLIHFIDKRRVSIGSIPSPIGDRVDDVEVAK